jgi:5'-AMP-activated protein kinase catalytic alpha subunit
MSSFSNYMLQAEIAAGSFGSVWKAKDKTSGRMVALKRITRGKASERSFNDEINAMHGMACEGVVGVHGHFEDDFEHCIVMDLAEGGDLFGYVGKFKKLGEHEARQLFRQVVTTVTIIHGRGWVHGDLKLENIVLVASKSASGQCAKLADMGFSQRQSAGGMTRGIHGTAHYAAPEIVLQRAYCGKAADLYACGVILYVMLVG